MGWKVATHCQKSGSVNTHLLGHMGIYGHSAVVGVTPLAKG